MNPIGAALDVLVLLLLVWALALGLKLNGRLKALRDGQDGFAKAVTELDVASRRAEAGLAEMRRAAEETHDSLLGRIETARGLLARLEAASVELAARAPSVSPLRAEPSSDQVRGGRHPPARPEGPPLRGRGEARAPLPLSRGAGELSAAQRVTEGARERPLTLQRDEPAPAGFADLIRRTLREPR